jgi:hypothetical protein
VHPLIVATPKFIQTVAPLLPLKPMDQSKCGVTQTEEATGAPAPPVDALPHALIDPSVLRAAKAYAVE